MASTPPAYTLPQVRIYQEFQQLPAAITVNLQALIAGPHATLVRHGVATEKASGLLGAYNPNAPVTYAWPGRPAGALIDSAYTKLFVDSAKLEYFTRQASVDGDISPVAGTKNQVKDADTSGGFKANGSANPRYALLYDRDVRVGDLVTVRGIGSDSVAYTIPTYVAGLASTGSDRTGATVQGSPLVSPANPSTQSGSDAVSLVAGTATGLTLTASVSGYSALADGAINDTYTIAVAQDSIGGDLTTAVLSVTTTSGLDDAGSVTPGASGVAFAVGSRGLSLTITQTAGSPDLVVGQVWHVAAHSVYVAPTVTAGGTYTGTAATSYVVTVATGGAFSGPRPPKLLVTTTTGVDSSGPTAVTATAVATPIGTLGVTFTVTATGTPLGLRKGDSWTVAVTPQADGAFRTLILGRNLPTPLLAATVLDLHLSIGRDIQLAQDSLAPGIANWTQLPESFTVAGGISAYDPSWTAGGVPLALPLTAGSVYVEYRAFLSDYVGAVGSISDVGQLDATIAGPLDPDNPMKWGVYEALTNANGATVNFSAVAVPTLLQSWSDLLGILVGRQSIYNIVPLTSNRAVHDLVQAHVNDQSSATAGRWRAAFVPLVVNTQSAVVDAALSTNLDPVLATFSLDSGGAGTTATIVDVPASNIDFNVAGVRGGDILRTSFSTDVAGVVTFAEYVVDAVTAGNEIRLLTGPPAVIGTAQRIEIWHPNTKDEQAADIGRQAGSFASSRICAVWPDTIGSAGTTLAGYYVCAALAGQVSGSAPHRGLTNAALAGFDDASRSAKYFNSAQLNVMAGSGVWIVTQDPDGTIKTRQGVTTDPTDVNSREEMVRRNVDSISLFLQGRLAPYIGTLNIGPQGISRINVELVSALEYLKSNGFTDTLGSQLIDYKIVRLSQDLLFKDRVVAVVNLTIPYSLNNLDCYLII